MENTVNLDIVNETLTSKGTGLPDVPTDKGTTAEVRGAAGDVLVMRETLGSPISAAQRRSLAGQSRVDDAGITAILARMLGYSTALAKESKLPAEAAENLLLLDASLGAARHAAWPILLFGLLRTNRSGAKTDVFLQTIGQIAGQSADLSVALGREEDAERKGARSQKAKAAGRKRRHAQGAAAVAAQQDKVASARRKHQLVTDASGGKAPPAGPTPKVKGQRAGAAGSGAAGSPQVPARKGKSGKKAVKGKSGSKALGTSKGGQG